MTIDSHTALQEGINAFKAGNKVRARELLMKLVETDENNEQAWVWLAGAMDDPEQQQTCLENALHLNPDNAQAKQGLAWLRTQHPQLFATPAPPPAAVPPPPAAAAPPPAPRTAAPPPIIPQPPASGADAPAEGPKASEIFIPIPVRPGDAPVGPPPCPWCGKPTQLTDKTCPSCKQSLMEQVERSNVRRIWSTLAGVLLLLSMLINLGMAGAILFTANSQSTAIKKSFAEKIKTVEATVKREKVVEKKEPLRTKLMAPIDEQIAEQNKQVVTPLFRIGTPMAVLAGLGIMLAIPLLRKNGLAYWISWGYALMTLGYLLIFNPGANFASLIEANNLTAPPAALLSAFSLLPALPVAVLIFLGLAIPQYTQATKRFVAHQGPSGDAEEHFNRGVSYRKKGYAYQALVEWERAVKANPRDASYRHALGMTYAQLKRYRDALRELGEGMRLDPANEEIKQAHKEFSDKQLGKG